MKIDMLPILKGEKKELVFDYPLTIEAGFSGVVFPEPVRVLGTIRDMAGYIALALTVTVPYETVCDRCLIPIHRSMELEFNKTVALEDTLENEDNDDYVIVRNRMLDLDEALQEAVVLSFPTPLPWCGNRWRAGSRGCLHFGWLYAYAIQNYHRK